ncbi:MAG: S8 family peptidase [Thermaurantimonas sp.]
MKHWLFLILSVTLPLCIRAQEHYIVYLNDKGSSLEMLSDPNLFLSPRAILRKEVFQIPIDESDLPVCTQYENIISTFLIGDDRILQKSKWLNALFLKASPKTIEKVRNLPFVKSVAPYTPLKSQFAGIQNVNYGVSRGQIEMLKGDLLHNQGFLGHGMLISVFDGGYFNTNSVAVFDSLFKSGRVKLTYNFNNNTPNIYSPGSHGTSVLGVLASYIPGQMVGSAPKADYILLQTEFEPTETRQEEYNWLAGAELSDSMGADVINSSLGYNTFDNPNDDYTLNQLDGKTAIVTQAALWAARKGILVVNSAGNTGNTSWQKVLFPADADSILAVGGVNNARQRVNFSSLGPTADNRIKPDVAAQAFQVLTVNSSGNAASANGTSFSAPLVSGLAACLWQTNPNKSFFEIRQAILQSGHQASNPDTLLGYGIPDFQLAYQMLLSAGEQPDVVTHSVYPVPAKDYIRIQTGQTDDIRTVKIYDGYGRLVYSAPEYNASEGIRIAQLPAGMYFITFQTTDKKVTKKFIKH